MCYKMFRCYILYGFNVCGCDDDDLKLNKNLYVWL